MFGWIPHILVWLPAVVFVALWPICWFVEKMGWAERDQYWHT